MADFKKAFDVLITLEFNSPSNFLHKNKTENDYTIAGIYKAAHPNWLGWFIVSDTLAKTEGDIRLASQKLHKSIHLKEQIMDFYKRSFWDRMKLDKVDNNNTATELFVFAVNAGTRNAVRKAQKIIGVEVDGLVGPMTLNALNEYDSNTFDMKFDEVEIQFYNDLIKKRPSFAMYRNGWMNRAVSV